MEIREFFEKAKQICEEYGDLDPLCYQCPLFNYCSNGFLGCNETEINELIDLVTKEN